MKKLPLIALLCILSLPASAQTNFNFYMGFVPTPAQWNYYFAYKQDYYGYKPLNPNGDTMYGPLNFSGTAPALTSCGTSPSISGNDTVGQITLGTGSPTGCVITFSSAKLTPPKCTVTWQANLAAMGYSVTTTALALTQTGTSSNKVNYNCTVTQ